MSSHDHREQHRHDGPRHEKKPLDAAGEAVVRMYTRMLGVVASQPPAG